MTTNRNNLFMADFAASDRRSAKAHIEGKSYRARAFAAVSTISSLLGRGDRAADDFKAVSRFVFKHREAVKAKATSAMRALTPVVGLVAGALLYYFMVQ